MLVYREFVRGVEALKDTIANADEFITHGEFNADTYYPMIQALQEENDISVAEITTLDKKKVMIRLYPGDKAHEIEMYVEGDWAYHLVSWGK